MTKQYVNKLILLVNLGSPDSLTTSSIRGFLRSFLSDKRVVGLPRVIWYPILYGIILPIRAKKLLHKYEQIWSENNLAPLVDYTIKQSTMLQNKLGAETKVDHTFCYGDNNIAERLSKLEQKYNFQNLIIIPLYPQYSSSTTAAVFDQVSSYYKNKYYIPSIKFINSFAGDPSYVSALASSIKKHWNNFGRGEKLVVSFHSVPVKLIDNGDIYIKECETTFALLCKELGFSNDNAVICYQSKFGKAEWVGPATNLVIEGIAKSGIKHIDVICPGFVSDCLETLEEVAIEYKDLFIKNGGLHLNYIKCLNDSEDLVDVLAKISQ